MRLSVVNKDNFAAEICIMKICTHPNIVQCIDSFLVGSDELWLIIEFMENGKFRPNTLILAGSLTEILNQFINDVKMEEHHILYVCREVLFGLSYVHNLQIIHRDIKSDNILVSRRGEVKISVYKLTHL